MNSSLSSAERWCYNTYSLPLLGVIWRFSRHAVLIQCAVYGFAKCSPLPAVVIRAH